MEHKNMPELKSKTKWDKENSVMVSMRLMTKGDADILSALKGKAKQTEIKRLLRIALLEVEKAKEEAHD